MNQNLTFKFDWRRLEIHPDLVDTFNFLIKIDQENKHLLNHFDMMMNLKKDILHLLWDCAIMMNKIHSNWLDVKCETTQMELDELQNLLSEIKRPVRSVMISLFAYMETLFSLLTVYKAWKELNEKDLMNQSKNNLRPFISKYILSKWNKYYSVHEKYFKELSPQMLIDLRNYLTHFYSVPDGIAIAQDRENPEIIEKREEQTKCIFIVPVDLYELLQYAAFMIVNEWHCDAIKNHEIFKRNMKNVIKIVWEKAAREVYVKRK